jgi:plastocyanin
MGPQVAGVPHIDTPEFRGLRRSEVPIWLLVTMGASGLFARWQLRVAGALTWFYDGVDGAYEYWPDGRDAPSRSVQGPFGDVALIGDNNRMYHRVGAVGDAEAFAARATVDPGSTIAWHGDGWTVHNVTNPDVRLDDGEVRISLLWKAVVFTDARDAAVFDDHADDLVVSTVVDTFRADLARRGIETPAPADPFTDPEWIRVLAATYPIAR